MLPLPYAIHPVCILVPIGFDSPSTTPGVVLALLPLIPSTQFDCLRFLSPIERENILEFSPAPRSTLWGKQLSAHKRAFN